MKWIAKPLGNDRPLQGEMDSTSWEAASWKFSILVFAGDNQNQSFVDLYKTNVFHIFTLIFIHLQKHKVKNWWAYLHYELCQFVLCATTVEVAM